VALGFNVQEGALDDRSVGAAASPTAVVDGTLVRTASGGAGFDSVDGVKTSLLSAQVLTVPNPDLRIMLKNGSSKPMEVLSSHLVTSLTLSMNPEWFMKHQPVFSRSSRLLLGGSSLPEEMTQNDLYNKLDVPNEYREVVMKLADLPYIRVKAVVNVNEAGDIDEREYWLPLNKSQPVGEIKRLVASADGLASANEKLLSNVDMSTGLSLVLRGKELDNDISVESPGLEPNALVPLFV
jgi:hypothetical protein